MLAVSWIAPDSVDEGAVSLTETYEWSFRFILFRWQKGLLNAHYVNV